MASKTVSLLTFSLKKEMKILVKMVYPEGIYMVEADTHVVWDQFDAEGPKEAALCSRGRTTKGSC